MRFRRHQEAAQAGTRRLLGLFALVVAGLVIVVNAAMLLAYRLTIPWADGTPGWFYTTNTVLVLVYVLGGCAIESMRLREGGAHVARLAGGREARGDDALERRLANVVAEMAIAAGIRAPAAWVLPREDAINAFAAGWGEGDAVVAVTRGALERLDRAELQGVVAHEISHLVHGDTTLNMRLIGMVWGLRLLFDLGRGLAAADDDGRRHPGAIFGVALIAVGSLGWAAARLLQAAVSRQREFLADASAVKYTRQVAGLGGALRKIATQHAAHADALAPSTGALAHLFLASGGGRTWWATHPPLAERIRRLFGRSMPDLPADPLPPPAAGAEPLLPLTALAAADAPTAAGTAGHAGWPFGGHAGDTVNGARTGARRAAGTASGRAAYPDSCAVPLDPLRRADPDDAKARARAREAEAIERIGRWHSAAELHAALRALVAAPRPPPADAFGALAPSVAAAMRNELAALGPLARTAALDALARRAASMPPAARRALLDAARRDARGPAQAMRWLLLRQRVRQRSLPFAAAGAARALAGRGAEAARVTAALGAVLADATGGAPTAAWTARASAAMQLPALVRMSPAAAARATLRAVVRLQHVAALQRPRLLRAWVQAWQADAALAGDERAAAVLATAASLLDLEPPAPLDAALPAPAAFGESAAAPL